MRKIVAAIVFWLSLMPIMSFGPVNAASIREPIVDPNPRNYEATLVIGRVPIQSVGAEFDVPVNLIYGGKKVCAVKAYLSFPPNMLEVVSLIHGPIFTMEAVKKFNNQAGTISYTLAPGGSCTTQSSTVYTVRFRTKAAGNAPIHYTSVVVGSGDDTGWPYELVTYKIENTVWINNDFAPTAQKFPSLNGVLIKYLEQHLKV